MGSADIEQLRGGGGVKIATVEGVEGLQKERQGDALEELVFFKEALDPAAARRPRLFVGLRSAPASSKPGPAGGNPCSTQHENSESHFVPPAVSFCTRPDIKYRRTNLGCASAGAE